MKTDNESKTLGRPPVSPLGKKKSVSLRLSPEAQAIVNASNDGLTGCVERGLRLLPEAKSVLKK